MVVTLYNTILVLSIQKPKKTAIFRRFSSYGYRKAKIFMYLKYQDKELPAAATKRKKSALGWGLSLGGRSPSPSAVGGCPGSCAPSPGVASLVSLRCAPLGRRLRRLGAAPGARAPLRGCRLSAAIISFYVYDCGALIHRRERKAL